MRDDAQIAPWRRLAAVCLGLAVPAALASGTAIAVVADPGARVELKQPSGASFEAQPFGDEWYHGYETVQGYTVLRDRETRIWKYAEPAPAGTLDPGTVSATTNPSRGTPKHLRDRRKAADRPRSLTLTERNAPPGAEPSVSEEVVGKAPNPANTGTQPTVVILVQFQDQASLGTTPTQWHSRFFGASNSVADFYDEVSYESLDIVPANETSGTANDGVIGWLTLNLNHPQADQLSNNADIQAAHETVGAAIQAANPFINYASFDDNNNGTLSADELHVTVIPAGREASQSCPGNTVWGHKHTAANFTQNVDGKWVGGDYTMFGEVHCSPSDHLATLGIMVHEIGHDLDWPDLYDVDGTSNGGVGYWSVMASGSWLKLAGQFAGSMPPHPDAFSKYYQGWTTPTQATGAQRRTLTQVATSPSAIRMLSNPGGVDWTNGVRSGAGEYFLVENRQQAGYDAALPGCGLVAWHVDETRTATNGANATDTRRLIDLEEADNDKTPFEAADPFRGQTFDDFSLPNTRRYDGSATGVRMANGDTTCAAMMGADFSDGSATVTVPNDAFANPTELTGTSASRNDDTTQGATKQTGEPDHVGNAGGRSVWYLWTAPGSGQVTINTVGSNFDTLLAAYTGTAVNALTEVASNDDIIQGTNQQSQITFNAVAGATYRIAVDGYDGASGTVDLSLSQTATTPVNDAFANSISLIGSTASRDNDTNQSATEQAGEPDHAGNAGGASVWYSWTAPAAGQVTIDTEGSSYDTLLAAYTGSAVDGLTEVASNDDIVLGQQVQSRITFNAANGTTYRIAVDGFNDDSGPDTGVVDLHLGQAAPAVPNTTIDTGPTGTTDQRSATFTFSGQGASTGFDCRLDSNQEVAFQPCFSPHELTQLGNGQHTFEVRARNGSSVDLTPASRTWTVDTTPDQPPVADFTFSCNELTCQFTDQSSDDGTIASRSWDFDDGGTSTQENPSHTFPGPGTYDVELTVTDNNGDSDTETQPVNVVGSGPQALTNGVPVSGLAGAQGTWNRYTIAVPRRRDLLKVVLSGPGCTPQGDNCVPDLDLYVRRGLPTDFGAWNCRPFLTGSNEVCRIKSPRKGIWHIGVQNYLASAGTQFTIRATHR